jgi:hypothetical protein
MTTRMIRLLAVILAPLVSFGSGAQAQDPEFCDVPSYFVASDSKLRHVEAAVKHDKRLNVMVLGNGSSALGGPRGRASLSGAPAGGAGTPPAGGYG